MIKTFITGGATQEAGEILRLLVHHPDIEITGVYSPENVGVSVCKIHHGLIGDIDLNFTGNILLDDMDMVFICQQDEVAASVRKYAEVHPDVRVVDLVSQLDPSQVNDNDYVYGVSEVFRKRLVRGARHSVVPHVVELGALIALYPLAAHLMLTNDIRLDVTLPEDQIENINLQMSAERVTNVLRQFQTGWDGTVIFTTHGSSQESLMELRGEIPCKLSSDELLRVFDSIYDDHGFTFFGMDNHHPREVIGTHKTLLGFKLEDEVLTIRLICDSRLRGGAGEAVHLMNLLFGLQEKIGLTLKAQTY